MSWLEVRDLSVEVGPKTLFSSLSFVLDTPGVLVVVGNNGAGKTSFVKALGNFIDYQGLIFWNEVDTKELTPRQSSRLYSFLPQLNPTGFSLKVIDVVLMGLAPHKSLLSGYTKAHRSESLKALEQLGIGDLEDRELASLSGGERQLVWLAQSIAQKCEVLVWDEPTQYLDLKNQEVVAEFLSNWVQSGKKAVVVTHDLDIVKRTRGSILNLSDENPKLTSLTSDNIIALEKQLRFGKVYTG